MTVNIFPFSPVGVAVPHGAFKQTFKQFLFMDCVTLLWTIIRTFSDSEIFWSTL